MKRLKTLLFIVILLTSLGMIGCGGGGATVQQSTTTLGQELQDLDEAYQQGLLSEKEYKSARKDLIEKRTE